MSGSLLSFSAVALLIQKYPDAERIIGSWIDPYNEVCPHSARGGRALGETYRDGARAA